jgi:hypothetical protein
MLIKSVLLFFLKVVLIECVLQLIRTVYYFIKHGTLPSKLVMKAHSHRPLNIGMNVLESLCVILLLYVNFNIYSVIGLTCCFTYVVQKVGERLLRNSKA